jgi:hypothetical protein
MAVVFMLLATTLAAHPPSMVTASYNMDKELLTVKFNHQVKNNTDHFVNNIVVLKNKKEIIIQKLSQQDSMESGSLFFKVNDLKPGDKLDIMAACNKMGKKTYTLEIKAPEPVTTKPAPSGK